MDDIARAKLKEAHRLRSLFNYNVGLERIDYRFDVIYPALNQIETEAANGELRVHPKLELEGSNEHKDV